MCFLLRELKNLVPHLVEGGVSIYNMQMELLFLRNTKRCEHETNSLHFEQLSRLKTNLNKRNLLFWQGERGRGRVRAHFLVVKLAPFLLNI